MSKLKTILKDSKTLTIICVVILAGMLLISAIELMSSDDKLNEAIDSTNNFEMDSYLCRIEGVSFVDSLISYDQEGSPIGVLVLCDNDSKETEIKIKNAVHTITGIPLSKICVYKSNE